ncbi:SH3 domain-containing protein [Profundibacter sp.]
MTNFAKVVSGIIAATVGLTLTATSVLAVEATAKSAVNVRSGPGVSYGKVDALYGGEAVEITECRGNWCHIQHPGPDGWVSGRYLIAVEGRSEAGGSTGGRSGSDDAAAAAIIGAIIGGVIAGNSSSPAPAPAPALPYGPDTCKPGYVWRDAIPGDHVCVRPARRSKAAHENSIAGSRVNPTGSYGPNTCKSGFVWREAYSGDVVCVTPARREQVRRENRDGPSHRVVAP